MTLISVVSGKGAPGVSVASLAWSLQWPASSLLVEADPRGGEVLVGYAHRYAGVAPPRNLLAVHTAASRGTAMTTAVRDNVLSIGENRWLLAGFPEPRQAAAFDWSRLARALAGPVGIDTIVDCGAVTAEGGPRALWSVADLLVLVVRATAPGVRAAELVIPRLRQDLADLGMGEDRLAVAVAGAGNPYSTREVLDALNRSAGGGRVRSLSAVAEIPRDPKVADYLSSGVKTVGNKVFDGSRFATVMRNGAAGIARAVAAFRSADDLSMASRAGGRP